MTDARRWLLATVVCLSLVASPTHAQTVALVDTGVDTTHPDLAGHIIGTLSLTGDGGGDTTRHGTMAAGLVLHIDPEATILSVKVQGGDDGKAIDNITVAQGIAVAAAYTDVRVINVNFAILADSLELRTAVAEATERGILVVAATGNAGTDDARYPAAYPCALGVGSVDEYGTPAESSIYGIGLSVMAHGRNITSTDIVGAGGYAPGDYHLGSGTSYAAPQVAGLASLLLRHYPHLTPADLQSLIGASGQASVLAERLGVGVVDPDFALALADTWASVPAIDCYQPTAGLRRYTVQGLPLTRYAVAGSVQTYTANRYGLFTYAAPPMPHTLNGEYVVRDTLVALPYSRLWLPLVNALQIGDSVIR